MTKLAPEQLVQLTTLMQRLLPDHKVSDWSPNTPILGAIPEFDSMMLANLLAGMESSFDLTIDDSLLSIESFESWGSLQSWLSQHLAQ